MSVNQTMWSEYAKEYEIMVDNIPAYWELLEMQKKIILKYTNLKFLEEGSFVADIGSGTGNGIYYVISEINDLCNIVSIEANDSFLAIQKKKLRNIKNDIIYENNQAQDKDSYNHCFDFIYMNHCLCTNSKPERDSIMKNLYDSLKPNGYLSITDIGRVIDVESWYDVIMSDIATQKSSYDAELFYNSTPTVRKVNSFVAEKQKSGEVFTHTLDEFEEYIRGYGFKILYSTDTLYRGIDDFIIAQKI